MSKRKGQLLIIVLSVIFLLFYIGIYNSEETIVFLNIIISEEENTIVQISEQKRIFGQVFDEQEESYHILDVLLQDVYNDNKKCFFLPDCIDLSNVYVTLSDEASISNQVFLDDDLIHKNKMQKFGILEVGMHEIIIDKEIIIFDVLKGASLPSVWIETKEGMQYIHDIKGNATEGKLKIISANGSIEYIGELESIKGRGNSSWSNLKKNYGIKLYTAESLLGMMSGKSWVLQGSAFDTIGLRDKIFLDMGIECGLENSVESEWIDLYIDKKYYGCYLLTEKITIASGRLEIGNLEEKTAVINDKPLELYERYNMNNGIERKGYSISNSPEDISGGYLLEIETYRSRYDEEMSGFVTMNDIPVIIKDPKYCAVSQVKYISSYVQQFEDALYSENGYNSSGIYYLEYIDLESFVVQYLIGEIGKNIDAGFSSWFFYKPQGDSKMYAGPTWDHDTALGNNNGWGDTTVLQNPEGLYVNRANWNAQLWGKPEFITLTEDFYKERFQGYLEELIEYGLDAYIETIYESVEMEAVYYGNNKTDEKIEFLRGFLECRKEYLDDVFIRGISE